MFQVEKVIKIYNVMFQSIYDQIKIFFQTEGPRSLFTLRATEIYSSKKYVTLRGVNKVSREYFLVSKV